jgi:2-methylcitrate dehydratase PrpD
MSLPHSAALAVALAEIADDGFALSVTDYESSLDDPRVKEIEAQVRCEVDPEVEAATTAEAVPARVTITMKDGTSHSTFVAAPRGSPSRPFAHDDHISRFRRELAKRLTERTCDEIVEIAANLADLDRIERLTDLLALARYG